MRREIDLEPMARAWYEVRNNVFVDQVAIVLHPTIEGGQCSPDGIVESTNSLIEIKVPNPENHLDNILTNGKQLEQYHAPDVFLGVPLCSRQAFAKFLIAPLCIDNYALTEFVEFDVYRHLSVPFIIKSYTNRF